MVKLESLNSQEIIELDQKLRQCALLAMAPYRRQNIDWRKTTNSNLECLGEMQDDLTKYEVAFEKLYKCRFPKSSKEVCKQIVDVTSLGISELFDRMDAFALTRSEMKILFPVAFYVLIMNNCFNKAALEKKRSRIKTAMKKWEEDQLQKKSRSITYTGSENKPKGVNTQVRFGDFYKISQRDLCAITRSLSEEKAKDFTNFDRKVFTFSVLNKRIVRKLRKESSDVIRPGYLRQNFYVNLAMELSENHKDLIYYEETAIAGIFLRDVLLVNKEKDAPLDRLLRLYIVNEMDRILTRTGVMKQLPAEVFLDMDNRLLRWYFEFEKSLIVSEDRLKKFTAILEDKLEEYRCLFGEKSDNDSVDCEIYYEPIMPTGDREETFETLYNDLKTNYTFMHDDVDKLLEYYLDIKVLKKGKKLIHSSLNYINTVILCLNKGGTVDFSPTDKHFSMLFDRAIKGCFFEKMALKYETIDIYTLNRIIEAEEKRTKKNINLKVKLKKTK